MTDPKKLCADDKVRYAKLSDEDKRAFRHGFKDIYGNPTGAAMTKIMEHVYSKFFADAINPVMDAVESVESAPDA